MQRIMEENTLPQEKLDLLETQIDKLKTEKVAPFQSTKSWSPAIWILVGMVVFIALGCWLWTAQVIKDSDNMSFLIVKCITFVAIVSIVSVLTHKVIFLVSSIEQRKSDYIMSIYKEREMLVINLRKSLANKVLDSITLEDKKDGSAESEKQDESECLKVKEKYEHEERMAVIKALGVDCDKKSIDMIHLKLVEIEKALKQ